MSVKQSASAATQLSELISKLCEERKEKTEYYDGECYEHDTDEIRDSLLKSLRFLSHKASLNAYCQAIFETVFTANLSLYLSNHSFKQHYQNKFVVNDSSLLELPTRLDLDYDIRRLKEFLASKEKAAITRIFKKFKIEQNETITIYEKLINNEGLYFVNRDVGCVDAFALSALTAALKNPTIIAMYQEKQQLLSVCSSNAVKSKLNSI